MCHKSKAKKIMGKLTFPLKICSMTKDGDGYILSWWKKSIYSKEYSEKQVLILDLWYINDIPNMWFLEAIFMCSCTPMTGRGQLNWKKFLELCSKITF